MRMRTGVMRTMNLMVIHDDGVVDDESDDDSDGRLVTFHQCVHSCLSYNE